MENSNIEILFNWLDETTNIIQQHVNEPYLDSLSIAMESLFYGKPNSGLDELLNRKLEEAVKTTKMDSFSKEQKRKAIQLAILKGMKGSTQQNHHMTPETIALLVKYLVEKLTVNKEALRIFDPVSGAGNLLLTVVGALDKQVDAFASEIDPTLNRLALSGANLQKIDVEFFQQDSLRPFLLDPVDIIVADLPVGYYPDDVRAEEFELKADEGHSYAHHLLLEQSISYTKDGGFLTLIIFESLFEIYQYYKLHYLILGNDYLFSYIYLFYIEF